MNDLRPENISVIDPINPAIDRVKLMLFQPFDLNKWLVIGLCAFVANLGKASSNGSLNFRYYIQDNWAKVKDFIEANEKWLIPTGIVVFIALIALWLVFTWLSSRGRFMFLHCVAENKAEAGLPWTKFAKHANSLFLFRIVLGLIGMATVIVPASMIVFFALTSPEAIAVLGSIMISFIIIVMILILLIIAMFTQDFVVPIMFLRTTSCIAAWREFLTILSVNKARFALYILFQIAMSMVIGILINAGICIGFCLCCISLLLLIPYVGTVMLLPIPVFLRSYSLYYLKQFGPQYDAFNPDIITVQAEPSQSIQ